MANATPVSFIRTAAIEPAPPPALVGGPIAWIRSKLFSSLLNTVLTLVGIYLLYLILPPLVRFLITDAVWSGTDREACVAQTAGHEVGACWAYVRDRFQYFTYGSYPIDQRWRVNIVFLLGALGLGWLLWLDAPRRDIGGLYFFVLFPVLGFILLVGGHYDFQRFLLLRIVDVDAGRFGFWIDFALTAVIVTGIAVLAGRAFGTSPRAAATPMAILFAAWAVLLILLEIDWGLTPVATYLWGGILVTLVVSLTGIVFSLPIGILLALGRRSRMPAVRLLSVIFIEFVRGVPLITVLFMANFMLPLFVPANVSPDKLLRALVGVAMFASAYMAEVVRGGLQAVPKGQYEGAMSVGLGYWQMMRLIILPQALRIVIPGIVNTFIGLFKDTTLVFVVGIFDFLKTIDATLVDPTWATPTTRYTGYAFAAMFYFVCCYGMSRYSLAVERRMAAGHRR